jgi:NTP pyrophosphatase (non-canonical NTP hydrolase)
MDFNDYQVEARSTAIYPDKNELGGLMYVTLGLTNEAGEVAGKLKKVLRDDDGVLTMEKQQQLSQELGDVLWYLAGVASELGVKLSEVAEMNLEKLRSRAARGTLQGSGDNR